MGKATKEHNKKIAKRNEKLKQDKNRVAKMQKRFFEELMKKEQASGSFDNNPVLPGGIDGPQIIDGPQL